MYDCTDEYCLTCADALFRARVLQVDDGVGLALVEVDGREEEVDVSLVEQIAPGDFLLIHGGVALSREDGTSLIEERDALSANEGKS